MLQDEEEMKTPLQKRLATFGQKFALAVLIICVIVLKHGFRGANHAPHAPYCNLTSSSCILKPCPL